MDHWYFTCQCQRCRDPTEFGTNTSGLPCTVTDCSGLLLPLDSESWRCTVCGCAVPVLEVREREENLLALAATRPCPYSITSSLQQLHSLRKGQFQSKHFIHKKIGSVAIAYEDKDNHMYKLLFSKLKKVINIKYASIELGLYSLN